jgi:putative endonuclease
MNYFVYLLTTYNSKNPVSYVGYTNNLTKRVKLHNDGKGAKFTKGRKWKLIFFKSYTNRNVAMREEYKLKKNYSLRRKIKNDYFNK